MRQLFLLFLSGLYAYPIAAQPANAVPLRWKIAPPDTLTYTAKVQIITDPAAQATLRGFPRELRAWLDSLQLQTRQNIARGYPLDSLSDQSIAYSFLQGKRTQFKVQLTSLKPGTVGVHIYSDKNQAEQQYAAEQRKKLPVEMEKVKSDTGYYRTLQRELARVTDPNFHLATGAVFADGGIASFYLPDYPKNLLGLFAELPEKKIRVNDTWPVDVHFLTRMNFQADSASNNNTVTCKAWKRQGKDSIAVLEYDIHEFIAGDGSKTNLYYKAIGEFSVTRGKWIKYDGLFCQRVEHFDPDRYIHVDAKLLFSLKQP